MPQSSLVPCSEEDLPLTSKERQLIDNTLSVVCSQILQLKDVPPIPELLIILEVHPSAVDVRSQTRVVTRSEVLEDLPEELRTVLTELEAPVGDSLFVLLFHPEGYGAFKISVSEHAAAAITSKGSQGVLN